MAEWVVLELTPKGETENPDVIRKSITRVLRGAEVYIPAVVTKVGEETVIHYLMYGYAFVRKDRPDRDYFRLDGGRFVHAALAAPSPSGQKVGTVPASYIEEMQEKVRAEANQGIGVGDTVRICSGPYRNIEATVITEIPEEKKVQVYVQLRSKQSILTLPRSVLEVINRAPLSGYFARTGYLRAWAQMAKAVLKYEGTRHQRLLEVYQWYLQIEAWRSKGTRLFAYTMSHSPHFESKGLGLKTKVQDLEVLNRWLAQGRRLFSFVFWDTDPKELDNLGVKYQTLLWFESVDERLRQLSMDIEAIARTMALGQKDADEMAIQNVVVDGHNLAFRCLYAPGMADLADDYGRPTGVILGFLRSLGSLRKKYPEAKFWVAWDGSSKRRRSQYPDYKANRKRIPQGESNGEPAFDQLEFLRSVLPLFGVRQVWNPDEEADDVVASLVTGTLSNQQNLLYSNDRDFLQLVTESTMLLVPATNSRREILFDVDEVVKSMGVPPEKVVQLRAFYGDSSDNLPGVPRVPKKILLSLVKKHGSVSGVYSSGFAGLTKAQYERLRSAEPQVRINETLMKLDSVEVSQIDPDVDVTEAAAKLADLKIKPEPIVTAFFGDTSDQT